MKLTNPQLAALADFMRKNYAFAGSVRIRQCQGFDPETGIGVIDIEVLDDTEVVDMFEISPVGETTGYA